MNTEPTTHDLIVALREKLGLFSGAMPISPKQAWDEALSMVAAATPAPAKGELPPITDEDRQPTATPNQ